jgi:hypothetical protein
MYIVGKYDSDFGMTLYIRLNGPFQYITWVGNIGDATRMTRSIAEQYRMIAGEDAVVID